MLAAPCLNTFVVRLWWRKVLASHAYGYRPRQEQQNSCRPIRLWKTFQIVSRLYHQSTCSHSWLRQSCLCMRVSWAAATLLRRTACLGNPLWQRTFSAAASNRCASGCFAALCLTFNLSHSLLQQIVILHGSPLSLSECTVWWVCAFPAQLADPCLLLHSACSCRSQRGQAWKAQGMGSQVHRSSLLLTQRLACHPLSFKQARQDLTPHSTSTCHLYVPRQMWRPWQGPRHRQCLWPT